MAKMFSQGALVWLYQHFKTKSVEVRSYKNQCETALGQLILASKWSQVGAKLGHVGRSLGTHWAKLCNVGATLGQLGLRWAKKGHRRRLRSNMEHGAKRIPKILGSRHHGEYVEPPEAN